MLTPLPVHDRFDYRGIHDRPRWTWPGGRRLAVYVGFNVEHFAFGEGLGAALGPVSPEPDVLNHSWREYGNRVGAWRCLELFEDLAMPVGALINTALYDHCPELVQAMVDRGDELIAHGHSNAVRHGGWDEQREAALLAHCRETILARSGVAPTGWLSPWISESPRTSDLLAEAGYHYTLNWCHDDQPTRMRTRPVGEADGAGLWSVPYPQELNDIPMLVARQMDAKDFAQMIVDQFDEMLEQAERHDQALVMGLALHPYLVGQPYRLRHLRRALRHVVSRRDDIWLCTPGQISEHMRVSHIDGL